MEEVEGERGQKKEKTNGNNADKTMYNYFLCCWATKRGEIAENKRACKIIFFFSTPFRSEIVNNNLFFAQQQSFSFGEKLYLLGVSDRLQSDWDKQYTNSLEEEYFSYAEAFEKQEKKVMRVEMPSLEDLILFVLKPNWRFLRRISLSTERKKEQSK